MGGLFVWRYMNSMGDRKPDGMLRGYIFRSRVSAIGYQVQVFRFGYRSRT